MGRGGERFARARRLQRARACSQEVDLIKDSAGEILDEACGRLKVDLSGNGKVSIAEGQNSGAVETTDSLGRMGFLSAKKETEMVLDVDLEGKAQRSSGECGNLGWSLSDNKLSIETDEISDYLMLSWVDRLEDRPVNPMRIFL